MRTFNIEDRIASVMADSLEGWWENSEDDTDLREEMMNDYGYDTVEELENAVKAIVKTLRGEPK